MSNNTIVDVIVRQPMSSQQISSYIAVPVGGSSGQVLAKASNATGDLVWIANSAASGTDLTITSKTSTQFTLVSSSGADAVIPQATITEAGLLIATDKVKLNSLATVATSGSYADLTGTPTIPAAQVNSDWSSVSGVSQILNKPTLGTSSSLNVPASGNAASGEVVKGNDTRLSDARTPLSHIHVIADVTGLQTVLDGKQPLTTVLSNTTASFTTALETKLNGIATGATANSSDATLLNRANHTGTQLASTISDFNTAADARVAAGIAGKQNVDADLTAIAALTGTGLARRTGVDTWTLDTNSYYLASNPNGYTANTGTVTTASIVTANGFSGSVATASTTPAITLTLQNATTGQSGQLTSTDWNTFNGKQAALNGTGFVKMTGTTVSYDNSTYITGNQTITVTGDVSGSGTTTITLNLGNNVVTNAKLAQVATATFKGRITASTGNVEDLTATQATSLLDTFTSGAKGLVGASGGGTTNFLRADGTWAAPSGGGGGNSVTVDVDFGSSFTDKAQVVVTGQSWVTATSNITCQVLCPTTSDPDELYLLNIKPVVSALVNSTGFTLTLYSEQEAKGIYKVMCVGV